MATIQKTDGRWCVVQYVDGKQKWKYFGRGLEAERLAREYDQELKAAGKVKSYRKRAGEYGPTFTELVDEYLAAKAGTISRVSIKKMMSKFQAVILPELGQYRALKLTPAILDKYVVKRSADVKLTTIRRELTNIQAVLNWSLERRLTARNPIAGYRRPNSDDEVIRPPSASEVKALLVKATPYLRRALLISYYTGVRPGNAELFQMTWSDVDIDGGSIQVRSARKGGFRSRSIPIHPVLSKELAQWHTQDDGNGPLIHIKGRPVKSVRHAWERAKKAAGITRRLRLYDFRHAFATAMLSAGGDLKATSELLGHVNPTITVRTYQHVHKSLHQENIARLPDVG
jgi:integrase